MPESKWDKPQEVDDITLAFPANVTESLLPPMAEIPEDFHRRTEVSEPWYRFQGEWFARGLHEGSDFVGVVLKPGVDGEMAFRHLGAIQGSYEPQHEHKVAGFAWLASQWFEQVVWKGDLEEESTDDDSR